MIREVELLVFEIELLKREIEEKQLRRTQLMNLLKEVEK